MQNASHCHDHYVGNLSNERAQLAQANENPDMRLTWATSRLKRLKHPSFWQSWTTRTRPKNRLLLSPAATYGWRIIAIGRTCAVTFITTPRHTQRCRTRRNAAKGSVGFFRLSSEKIGLILDLLIKNMAEFRAQNLNGNIANSGLII
jgi:hypothetical protein